MQQTLKINSIMIQDINFGKAADRPQNHTEFVTYKYQSG